MKSPGCFPLGPYGKSSPHVRELLGEGVPKCVDVWT